MPGDKFLASALDFRQDLIDYDIFAGGFAQRGIEPLQQIGYAFRVCAHQRDAGFLADGGQDRAPDWRDFADRDLTMSRIEERLDILKAFGRRFAHRGLKRPAHA
ncbi:MAG: hypothetical protein RB191_09320 [Terriglobia bacterium]|nr:hypothetical protein [Terriglobia bacterium]